MFLALDIGNTHVKAGLHDGTDWVRLDRFSSPDDPSEALRAFLGEAAVEQAGLCSVVPGRTAALREAVRGLTGCVPVEVRARMDLPFTMAYATPETLGADRIAAAAAAWLQFGTAQDGSPRPVLALDAGTAITTEVVTAEGVYLGGAIAPGPDLLRRALSTDTAQLPQVDWPDRAFAVGDSTHEAIRAGLSTLVLDGVAGLLTRTDDHLETRPYVVATGGWAPWLAKQLDGIDRVEPALVLDGVRLLVKRPSAV